MADRVGTPLPADFATRIQATLATLIACAVDAGHRSERRALRELIRSAVAEAARYGTTRARFFMIASISEISRGAVLMRSSPDCVTT